MPGRRIIMAVTNDLVTDQRVDRSCTALTEAGYEVTLVGRRLLQSAAVVRNYKTERFRLLFRNKVFFYAEYNIRLFIRLLFAQADAFYANDTDTLPACYMAARIRGKALFFDAHEMFPEVPELVGRNRVKFFWEGIEGFVFPRLAKRDDMAAATVCKSIADIYYEKYGIRMAVVRNVPMVFDVKSVDISHLLSVIPKGRRILLYQGAVNVGRGIEALIEAMPLLPECHFLIAGVGDKYEELHMLADKTGTDNITFLGRLEPTVLHSLTPHADLGISLLENRGLNYYYSFPNRIADFVQAGVPVLATDFPEIHRVVNDFGIGTLMAPAEYDASKGRTAWPDKMTMAKTIRDTLAYWDGMDKEKRKAVFDKAAENLNWENDKKVLLKEVDTIFKCHSR